MRRLFTYLFIGSLSLMLAVGISVGFEALTSGVQAHPSQVVVDTTFPLNIPGPTIDLAEGEHHYNESDVYREGMVGIEPPIGKATWRGVATEPIGVHGGVYTVVYEIFGEGQIHLSVVFDPSTFPGDRGIIIGGTGTFRGISGEYFDEGTDDPTIFRATFDSD